MNDPKTFADEKYRIGWDIGIGKTLRASSHNVPFYERPSKWWERPLAYGIVGFAVLLWSTLMAGAITFFLWGLAGMLK